MTDNELRDHFAGLAMQGMLSACQGFNGNTPQVDRLTKTAYKYANDMMQARHMEPAQLNKWSEK